MCNDDGMALVSPVEATAETGYGLAGILTWGPTDGPLALLLHGFPDTAWTWRLVAPRLAERGWRVVAPFSRGYAPSDLAPDGCYQLGALVRDVMDLHRALDGDSKAVLVGHDWGAFTAYGAGALDDSPFARVVAMSVPPNATSRRAFARRGAAMLILRQLRASWYILFNQLPVLPERLFTRLIHRLWADWSPGFDSLSEVAYTLQALPTPERRSAAIDYYRAMVRPRRRSKAFAKEQQSCTQVPAAPTLYLYGDRDGALLPEVGADAVADLSPGSRAAPIPGAGHFPQLERPDLVATEILDFIGPAPT